MNGMMFFGLAQHDAAKREPNTSTIFGHLGWKTIPISRFLLADIPFRGVLGIVYLGVQSIQ